MDLPEELQCLLFHKGEATCHSTWITTTSGYIWLFLFETSNLSADDKEKWMRILSYIASEYVPTFMTIHLRPKVWNDPYITSFQRELLVAYKDLEKPLLRL